jgi:hypothetical protein
MNEKLKKFKEISALYTFDLVKNNPDEYKKLGEKQGAIFLSMTLDELLEAKENVAGYTWGITFLPRIRQLQAEQNKNA